MADNSSMHCFVKVDNLVLHCPTLPAGALDIAGAAVPGPARGEQRHVLHEAGGGVPRDVT